MIKKTSFVHIITTGAHIHQKLQTAKMQVLTQERNAEKYLGVFGEKSNAFNRKSG